MSHHNFKVGDRVRFIAGGKLCLGTVVGTDRLLVLTERDGLTSSIRAWVYGESVFAESDVAGFAAHVRNEIAWMQRQLERIEAAAEEAVTVRIAE